ncbi:MAG: hypothetical protein MR031_03940 [Tenericutes bacterium]|nr:hypothetical protein [Mycoplasmatota bacterium]
MLKELEKKDSISLLAKDYIDKAFPLQFSEGYTGPKNVTFGSNKVQRDNFRNRVKNGMSIERSFIELVKEDEDVELSDREYAGLLRRYINLTVPGKTEETLQMDLKDIIEETAFRLVSEGYSLRETFKYVIADVEPETYIVVRTVQKVKTVNN